MARGRIHSFLCLSVCPFVHSFVRPSDFCLCGIRKMVKSENKNTNVLNRQKTHQFIEMKPHFNGSVNQFTKFNNKLLNDYSFNLYMCCIACRLIIIIIISACMCYTNHMKLYTLDIYFNCCCFRSFFWLLVVSSCSICIIIYIF